MAAQARLFHSTPNLHAKRGKTYADDPTTDKHKEEPERKTFANPPKTVPDLTVNPEAISEEIFDSTHFWEYEYLGPHERKTRAGDYVFKGSGPPHLTHTNEEGEANMVDISHKPFSVRLATAKAYIFLGKTAFDLVRENQIKKGHVLTVAEIAGIMAAKQTSNLIPLCHALVLSKVEVKLTLNEETYGVEIEATAKTRGQTGVEMEALVAANIAALTVYDMCKAVTRDMTISDIRLVRKTGGVGGDYLRKE